MAPFDPDTWVKPFPNQDNSILEKSGTVRAGAYRSSGREWTKPNGSGVALEGTGVNVAAGTGVNVAAGTAANVAAGTGVNVAAGTAANVAAGTAAGVAESATSVG
jgi:hypothetical protein